MAIKKRKTAEEHVASTPVKHVVEVVEEETSISSIAEAPPQEAAQTPHEASAESAQTIPRESELQEEAVVAELFKRPKPPAVMPEIAMHTESRSKKKLLIWALVILIPVALLAGGIVLVKQGTLPLLSIAPSPTPTPTPEPTPTPQPVNKEDITIQILNGGGVPGAASKMKAFLEDKGYTVADVANADDYTYDKTEVQVQEGKEAYQKLLIDDLEDTYALATDAAALASTVSYDARVIVGKE